MIFDAFDDLPNAVHLAQTHALIAQLDAGVHLSHSQFHYLISQLHHSQLPALQDLARAKRTLHYGNQLYIRGLIEISNICTQDCYYCGIRASNSAVQRYAYTYDVLFNTIELAYARAIGLL
jgi:biotin synthase